MSQVKEYLVQLGLSLNEASALEVLLKGGSLTAKEVSTESGIAYTKVYAALDSLSAKGVMKHTVGNPRMYHALDSDLVFSTLIQKQKEQLSTLEKRKETVMSEVQVGVKPKEEHEFDSNVWMFNSTDAIYDEVGKILLNTKKESVSLGSKAAILYGWGHPNTFNGLYMSAKKKVMTRAIYSQDVTPKDIVKVLKNVPLFETAKNMYKMLYALKSDYYDIRILPEGEIQNEFIVSDKKTLGMALRDDSGLVKWGLEFQNRSIAQFMYNYFNLLWERAEPVGLKWYKEVKEGLKK